jgi:hypothetical protein
VWSTAVTISPALAQSFDAEQLRAMGVAFENACRSLGLTDTNDRLTEIIATKIIATAKAGETDPVRLFEAVMHWASAA